MKRAKTCAVVMKSSVDAPGGLHDGVERFGGVAGQLEEVAVREDTALRTSGGAGGVDERRDVGTDGEGAASFDLRIGH